jgi:hypothetical protein
MPLGGKSNVTTLAGNRYGYYLTFQSDRFGFRNPDVAWDMANSPKGTDAILLGADIAQGYMVQEHSSIAGILRTNKIKTISLGCNKNGPLVSLATLREYGKQLKSKSVVYIFKDVVELSWLIEEKQHPILASYLEDKQFSQGLRAKQDYIDRDIQESYNLWEETLKGKQARQIFLDARDSSLRRLITGRHIRQMSRIFLSHIQPFPDGNLNRQTWGENLITFEKILKEMQNISQRMGANFIFVYVPDAPILYKKVNRKKGNQPIVNIYGYKTSILQILKDQSIYLLDLEPILIEEKQVERLFPLGGLNELGILPDYIGSNAHRIIAEAIQKKLLQINGIRVDSK